MRTESDFMAGLERLDAFLDGTEPGDIPLEVLRKRGIEMPDEATLSDEDLHRRLWEIITAMKTVGLVIEFTDHLSDRDLYRYLGEVLQEETMLSDGPGSAWHLSPIGSGSEEDNDIYLRYYADDEERVQWAADGTKVPPKEPRPYDRDRLLPQQELGEDA